MPFSGVPLGTISMGFWGILFPRVIFLADFPILTSVGGPWDRNRRMLTDAFIHWTPGPPFSEKALFFTDFCFVASPPQNSVDEASKYRGCQNGAFGKRSFCLGDTPPFSSISGVWAAKSLVFVGGMWTIRILADFRQNRLFLSVGEKNTVCQNDRLDNPENRPLDCLWLEVQAAPQNGQSTISGLSGPTARPPPIAL